MRNGQQRKGKENTKKEILLCFPRRRGRKDEIRFRMREFSQQTSAGEAPPRRQRRYDSSASDKRRRRRRLTATPDDVGEWGNAH